MPLWCPLSLSILSRSKDALCAREGENIEGIWLFIYFPYKLSRTNSFYTFFNTEKTSANAFPHFLGAKLLCDHLSFIQTITQSLTHGCNHFLLCFGHLQKQPATEKCINHSFVISLTYKIKLISFIVVIVLYDILLYLFLNLFFFILLHQLFCFYGQFFLVFWGMNKNAHTRGTDMVKPNCRLEKKKLCQKKFKQGIQIYIRVK